MAQVSLDLNTVRSEIFDFYCVILKNINETSGSEKTNRKSKNC